MELNTLLQYKPYSTARTEKRALYAGLLTAAVSTLAFGVNLFTPAYVLPVLILPLVLMLLREPLSHLLAKDPHWREFSVGEGLGTGFFELFETLLSYLTNTLSFMRVGAYAITSRFIPKSYSEFCVGA